jgi:AcrR family transcriptional regulator
MARKRGVTLEQVLSVSEGLADAEGLDGVTLAAVARALRIRSPSLYSHVDGLGHLLRLLALSAAGKMESEFREAAGELKGAAALRAIAHRYRDFARRHPGCYAAAQRAVRPGEDEELYAALAGVVSPVLRALEEAGAAPGERIHLARALRSALHGFVELERTGGFGMPEAVDASFDHLVELILSGVRSQTGRKTKGAFGTKGSH